MARPVRAHRRGAVGERALELALEHSLRLALAARALQRAAELLLLQAVAAILREAALLLRGTRAPAPRAAEQDESGSGGGERREPERYDLHHVVAPVIGRLVGPRHVRLQLGVAHAEAIEQRGAPAGASRPILGRCIEQLTNRDAPAASEVRLLGEQRAVV